MNQKPIIVGESNPYGADPAFALYPAPPGCAGQRLCDLILGMRRKTYMDVFDRVNLCAGKWSIRDARRAAAKLLGRQLILCGSKVTFAFGVPFQPFTAIGIDKHPLMAIIPHPSGLCRLWQKEGAVEKARAAILEAIPALSLVIGNKDQ